MEVGPYETAAVLHLTLEVRPSEMSADPVARRSAVVLTSHLVCTSSLRVFWFERWDQDMPRGSSHSLTRIKR